jgi:predicted AAA+ superfamily ATPase
VYHRVWDPVSALKRKSVLLLGPRQTGKSTLLRQRLPGAAYINLLDGKTYRQLEANPERLYDMLHRTPSRVAIIDEIQRIPELTNEVQRLLFDRPEMRCMLTGSSARKLKKHGVNLLGGRLSRQLLCPITAEELTLSQGVKQDYRSLIAFGGLPNVLASDHKEQELDDYVETYLKEEIQQEAQVRKLSQFTRFLQLAALSVGQQIMFSNVGNDAQVPATTVRDYFQLLEDTLVGHLLPCFSETKKRKAFAAPKFYFFDVGVDNALRGTVGVEPGDSDYGIAFEQFVFCELLAWKAYYQPRAQLYYWRSLSQFEVDFLIRLPNRWIGIEVKSSSNVSAKHLKGLHALADDLQGLTKAVICEERHARTLGDISVVPAERLPQWLAKL